MKPYDVYVVTVRRVPGVSRARMRNVIQDAIAMYGGQLGPQWIADGDCMLAGDPLGVPCPLMKRGAVRVFASPRPASGNYGLPPGTYTAKVATASMHQGMLRVGMRVTGIKKGKKHTIVNITKNSGRKA